MLRYQLLAGVAVSLLIGIAMRSVRFALADLRARADQGVAVDHRARADEGAIAQLSEHHISIFELPLLSLELPLLSVNDLL